MTRYNGRYVPSFIAAMIIIEIIKLMNPATMSRVPKFTRFMTENITESAKGNTIFAVTMVTSLAWDLLNPSRVRRSKHRL